MRKTTVVFSAMVLAALACTGHAQSKLAVQVPAAFDPALAVSEEKKKSCDVARRLGDHVLENVLRWSPQAVAEADPEKAGEGRSLRLSITGLDGANEKTGPMSEHFWSVTVRAELFDGSRSVAATSIRRRSNAGQPGDCQATHKIARVLGMDVSRWLLAQRKQ